MSREHTIERRACRLMHAYPASWRERYGEEFLQLLLDDVAERPFAPSRTADVLLGGSRVRLIQAGWIAAVEDPATRVRRSLGALAVTVMAFSAAGVELWAQLGVSWQWSAPPGVGARSGMYLMSAAILGLGVLAVLAGTPLIVVVVREVRAGHLRRFIAPLALAILAAAILVIGCLHIGQLWPGTGGHNWAGRNVVPTGAARFGWAATLWISAYWVHPRALGAFPVTVLTWMVLSPLASVTLLAASGRALGRLPLSARALRLETRIGMVAALGMVVFLAGAVSWVCGASGSVHGLFRVGTIDTLVIAFMGLSLLVGRRVSRRTMRVLPYSGQ